MIDFIVVSINIILRRLLVESAGQFWWPAEFGNVENPDFENLKHLQNPGNLSPTAPSMLYKAPRAVYWKCGHRLAYDTQLCVTGALSRFSSWSLIYDRTWYGLSIAGGVLYWLIVAWPSVGKKGRRNLLERTIVQFLW